MAKGKENLRESILLALSPLEEIEAISFLPSPTQAQCFLAQLPLTVQQNPTLSEISCLMVSIVLKRYNDQGSSKDNIIGTSLLVERFSPLSSRREHDILQADMVLEMRVLHLDPKAARRLTSRQLGGRSQSPPTQ
jgi:hypothetical protein